jgi:hypothetical protein
LLSDTPLPGIGMDHLQPLGSQREASALPGEHAGPRPLRYPTAGELQETVRPEAHPVCDIRAPHVGIVRKSCGGGGQTSLKHAARLPINYLRFIHVPVLPLR